MGNLSQAYMARTPLPRSPRVPWMDYVSDELGWNGDEPETVSPKALAEVLPRAGRVHSQAPTLYLYDKPMLVMLWSNTIASAAEGLTLFGGAKNTNPDLTEAAVWNMDWRRIVTEPMGAVWRDAVARVLPDSIAALGVLLVGEQGQRG